MIPFPDVAAGDPVRISATTYLAFRQCPAQAWGRTKQIYPPETMNSFNGAVAHRLFARHFQKGPIADVAQAVREEIGAGLNQKLGAVGIHRPSELEETILTVTALYERFRRFPDDGFRAAEVTIEVEPREGVWLIGKVDAVFDEKPSGPLLRDWKTGPLHDPMTQLFFYALLWALHHDEMPHEVEAVSVQTGERARHRPTEEDLELVADEVGALARAMRHEWPLGAEASRNGGPWCRYCPLLDSCEEGREAVAITSRQ